MRKLVPVALGVSACIALSILAGIASAILSPATASAAQSCGTRGFDFGRVTVKVAGAASCPLGWSAYRSFRRGILRTGRYPQWIRPRSPLTGRRYALARIDWRLGSKRAYWRYTGSGRNGSGLDVRLYWVAY